MNATNPADHCTLGCTAFLLFMTVSWPGRFTSDRHARMKPGPNIPSECLQVRRGVLEEAYFGERDDRRGKRLTREESLSTTILFFSVVLVWSEIGHLTGTRYARVVHGPAYFSTAR